MNLNENFDASLKQIKANPPNKPDSPNSNDLRRFLSPEAQAELHEHFEATFEHAPIGLAHVDSDGFILRANDYLCSLLCLKLAASPNISWRFLDPDGWWGDAASLPGIMADDQRRHMAERVLVRADGTRVWSKLSASWVSKRARDAPCILIVAEDISERRQVQQALAESETRTRALFEQASEAIFISNADGIFLEVNTRACEVLGYTREELLGLCGRDLIDADDLARTGWRYDDVLAGSLLVTERLLRRKDGTALWAELSNKRLTDGRVECILRDITKHHKAEEERALAEIALRRVEAMRREELTRRFAFMRDVLASVTDGRLILCQSAADLPPLLPQSSDPILLLPTIGLRELRRATSDLCVSAGLPEERLHDMLLAVGEAGMNCIVHVGEGTGQMFLDSESGMVQARITDRGAGISLENLPRATLKKGYSSAGTLGHGMKIMLETADRVFLLTGPSGTTVILEMDKVKPFS